MKIIRLRLLIHVLTICWIIFLTLLLWLPDPRVLVFGWTPSEDVGGYSHLISFMILGFLCELDRRRCSFELVGLALIFYAVFTETGQIFFPYREFDLNDIIQNFAGLFVGLEIGTVTKIAYRFLKKFFCNEK
ncbi:MAG: VanZ family protein [Planctomycetaceae bacterium]|jgi:VanZ family protein|nr:VanZ family protein [Planctomycetaceae bacterium]